MAHIFRIIFLLFLSGSAFSQTFPVFPVGEYWQFPDARTLGLAGAGSVSQTGVAALRLNPAAMAANPAGIHAAVATRARSLEERRSFPVFDRFQDINQFGIYAINTHWFANFQGGVQLNPAIAAVPFLRAIAVGAFEEVDLSYDYREEVRQNVFPDPPLAENRIRLEGKITRYSLGAAFRIIDPLDVGVQVGFLQGDIQRERSIAFFTNPAQNVTEISRRERRNTPVVASLGAVYRVNPYVTLGGHVQLPYSIDYDLSYPVAEGVNPATLPATESLEYPRQLTVGLEYRGQQALQARLNVDVSYEWWSDTEQQLAVTNADIANGLDNVIKIKAGIEHIFFNQVPFRVGMQYRTSFLERSTARILFAAGTGFRGNPDARHSAWQIDLSAGFSRLDYRFPDLFDEQIFGGVSRANLDRVEESLFFGVATLRVNIR